MGDYIQAANILHNYLRDGNAIYFTNFFDIYLGSIGEVQDHLYTFFILGTSLSAFAMTGLFAVNEISGFISTDLEKTAGLIVWSFLDSRKPVM
ncbi:hypothetical protein A7U60_g5357 [Sanghuangporus baumii]|uniref:Uncharacterized protein n=1 Tax=Sanghuangporus baumii TaxID=108892 RepID=A0A9Q5N3K6_SANBA|nr:hypothetical protein A7U60_g5357 [Sanghuangporus baumii]